MKPDGLLRERCVRENRQAIPLPESAKSGSKRFHASICSAGSVVAISSNERFSQRPKLISRRSSSLCQGRRKASTVSTARPMGLASSGDSLLDSSDVGKRSRLPSPQLGERRLGAADKPAQVFGTDFGVSRKNEMSCHGRILSMAVLQEDGPGSRRMRRPKAHNLPSKAR